MSEPPPRVRPPARLAGAGLVLREWDDGDLDAMVALFDDPDVARYTPLASPFGAAAATEYLAGSRRDRATGRRLRFAVTRDGGAALGEVLLIRHDDDATTADLGYMIGPAHRGAGLAHRALGVLVEHAYAELGLATLRLRIQPSNAASNAVARRAGFEPVPGPLPHAVLRDRPVPLRTWVHHRSRSGAATGDGAGPAVG